MQSNLERPPLLWLQLIYPNSVRKYHDVGRDLPLFSIAIVYIAPVTKRDIVNETLRKAVELCIPKVLNLHSFRKWIYLADVLFIQPWVWHMPEYRGWVNNMQQFKLRKQMWFCILVCVESQATMKISLGNQHTQTAQFTCWYLTVMLQKEMLY